MAIVIVALSILTIIGVQTYLQHIRDAKIVEAKSEAIMLEMAISQYNFDHPSNPLTAETINMNTLIQAGLILTHQHEWMISFRPFHIH